MPSQLFTFYFIYMYILQAHFRSSFILAPRCYFYYFVRQH